MNSRLRFVLSLLAISLLLACTPASEGAPSKKTTHADTLSAYVDVINYRHDRTYKYSLYDLTQEQAPLIGGGIVERLVSGGNVNCCIALPKVWHAGLKVKMAWGEGDETIKKEVGRFERELEIPHYTQAGNLYVVFGPDKQPSLVVSPVEPGHPDWPGSIKQTAWDYCEASSGRKACKAARPKRFDAEGQKGVCVTLLEEKFPNPKDGCDFAMYRCMEDYEDEVFCKKIIWEKPKK